MVEEALVLLFTMVEEALVLLFTMVEEAVILLFTIVEEAVILLFTIFVVVFGISEDFLRERSFTLGLLEGGAVIILLMLLGLVAKGVTVLRLDLVSTKLLSLLVSCC